MRWIRLQNGIWECRTQDNRAVLVPLAHPDAKTGQGWDLAIETPYSTRHIIRWFASPEAAQQRAELELQSTESLSPGALISASAARPEAWV